MESYGIPILFSEHTPGSPSRPRRSRLCPVFAAVKGDSQNLQQAETYNKIQKCITAGYVKKLSSSEIADSTESWCIPHHIVVRYVKVALCLIAPFQTRINAWIFSCVSLHFKLCGFTKTFFQPHFVLQHSRIFCQKSILTVKFGCFCEI